MHKLLKLSEKKRCFLFSIFLFTFNFNFAQEGIESDTTVSRITLNSGAQIYSEDDFFNKQILSNKVAVENSSISHTENQKVLKLVSMQSVAQNNDSKNLKKTNEKLDDTPIKELAIVNKKRPVNKTDFKNNRFDNLPGSNEYFYSNCLSRDCVSLNNSNFKSSKFIIQKNRSRVNNVQNILATKIFNFYSNQIFDGCYSKAYSVRPPPIV